MLRFRHHPKERTRLCFHIFLWIASAVILAGSGRAAGTSPVSSAEQQTSAETAEDAGWLPIAIVREDTGIPVIYTPDSRLLEINGMNDAWHLFLADADTEALLLPQCPQYTDLQQALFFASDRRITSGMIGSILIRDGKKSFLRFAFSPDDSQKLCTVRISDGREIHYYYDAYGHPSQICMLDRGSLMQYAELSCGDTGHIAEILFLASGKDSSVREVLSFGRTPDGVITSLSVRDQNGQEPAAEYGYQHNEDGTISSVFCRTNPESFSRYAYDENGNLLCSEDMVFAYAPADTLLTEHAESLSREYLRSRSGNCTEKVTFSRGYLGSEEYAFILGRSPDGNVTWCRITDLYPTGEVSQTGEIGCWEDKAFYFYAGGSVCALDMQTGNALWQNDSFGGGSAVSAIGPDGSIYICGYYGPSFLALSSGGSVLFRSYYLGYEILWPSSMQYSETEDLIYVTMEADLTQSGSPTVCIIDPHTFSYRFQ